MQDSNTLLNQCCDEDVDSFLEKLNNKITVIEDAQHITNHSKEDTRRATSLLLPFLRLSLSSHKVVQRAAAKQNIDGKCNELETVMISSKLKQACAMLMLRDTSSALGLLLSLSDDERDPLCACRHVDIWMKPTNILKVIKHMPTISLKKLLTLFIQPCVVFLPTESLMISHPIKYEMIRTFGQQRMSDMSLWYYFWFSWGVVEGKFLARFLRYVTYRALCDEVNVRTVFLK